MTMATPMPWPGTRSGSYTRRIIHYSQVMGELLLNYFQRWTDRKWGDKLPSLLTKEEDNSQKEDKVWEDKDGGK